MLRTVVCVSGGGTNLQAILDALDQGRITNVEIRSSATIPAQRPWRGRRPTG